jgi:hypothetical protein
VVRYNQCVNLARGKTMGGEGPYASQPKKDKRGWGCKLVVECLLSLQEALGSIPSTAKTKKGKEKQEI